MSAFRHLFIIFMLTFPVSAGDFSEQYFATLNSSSEVTTMAYSVSNSFLGISSSWLLIAIIALIIANWLETSVD